MVGASPCQLGPSSRAGRRDWILLSFREGPSKLANSALLTTGLAVGARLDKEDVERGWEMPGCFVLLVNLVERHGEVFLDRKRGLGGNRKGKKRQLGSAGSGWKK